MKLKRKYAALLLSLGLIAGMMSTAYAAESALNEQDGMTTSGSVTDIVANDVQNSTAAALTVSEKADILNKLGMISGDGNGGYNLQSKLKRSEAITFIIKLMGKDIYIKENKDTYKTSKFTDVKATDWFIPYVAYCEQNAITSGIGNGKFGPNEYISEKSFLVLVMKSLGYSSEAGDFSWENVYDSAAEIGLVSSDDYQQKQGDNYEYLRQDVVNVMYAALTKNIKDSNLNLLQMLVNEGVIDRLTANSSSLLKDTTIAAISSITPQNENRISISFNENIKPLTIENIKIYESDRKFKVLSVTKIISQSDDKLIISTEKQTAEKQYTLELSNITDLEGNIDKELTSTFSGYKLSEIKSDLFKISKVENISTNQIKINFTHPVNENLEIPSYYQIYEDDQIFIEGKSSTLSVKATETEKNVVILTMTNAALNLEKEYKVKLSGNLISVYGAKLNNGSGDESTFVPKDVTGEQFSVIGTYPIGYNAIQLNFNKPVNPVLARQIYNYNITDPFNKAVQISEASVIGADGKSVRLTINSVLIKANVYNIMINRLTDVDKQEEIVEKTFSFSGDYPDKIDLGITNVAVTDLDIMTVSFNRPILEESALKKEYYTIVESGTGYRSFSPDNIYFSKESPNQVKLYFKSNNVLKNLTGYTVRINYLFKDYTGLSANKVMEYSIVPVNATATKLTILKAAIISPDTILIKFNGKEIATDAPNSSVQNYHLEYTVDGETYKKIPIAVTYIDNQTVVLKFDELNSEKLYVLKCKELKNYAGEIGNSTELQCNVVQGQ